MIPEASSFSCRHLWSTLVFHIVGLAANSVEVKNLLLSAVRWLHFSGIIRLNSPRRVLDTTREHRRKRQPEEEKEKRESSGFYSETSVYIKHGCHFFLWSKHGLLKRRICCQFQHTAPWKHKKSSVVLTPTAQPKQLQQLFSEQLCHTITIKARGHQMAADWS